MKTHDLAKALEILINVLKASPNVELNQLTFDKPTVIKPKDMKFDPISFGSFVAFATFTKRQWVDLINEYNLPIKILTTDSSRDIMGKIMKYFNEDIEARVRLMNEIERKSSKASPELMNALATLLKL
jgi:hypothetical protein